MQVYPAFFFNYGRPVAVIFHYFMFHGIDGLGGYHRRNTLQSLKMIVSCVCFLPIHSGHQVRWTYQPGSHRISHPPYFCGACLNFSSEKDSAIPFPRRP